MPSPPVAQPHSEPHSRLYTSEMVKRVMLGVQDFRRSLKDRLALVEKGEHTVLSRRGKTIAVMVPIDWYRRVSVVDNDPTEF